MSITSKCIAVANYIIEETNKFNEDKRLNSRHGKIEFITAINYINKYIKKNDKVLDIGAGTGKYSIYLYNEGYDVTALELVKLDTLQGHVTIKGTVNSVTYADENSKKEIKEKQININYN